jgi:chorismate mutase/prephenate dehydratase
VPKKASIDTLRAGIDEIDRRLTALLNRRARLVVSIGKHKARSGRVVYSPDREKLIFQKLQEANRGPLSNKHLQAIFREIISSCLSLEKPLRVTFLGPAGTYSQEAAMVQFGSGAELVPAGSIDAIFDEVERGRADYGVVPVENSTEGVVAQTLDRFTASPLSIKAEVLLRVDHCLLVARGKREPLRRIVSHPQSLAQCRDWLARSYPNVPLEEVASNAAAARVAVDDRTTAAIAGRQAAERYRLAIIADNIQDLPNNVTRFLVISPDGQSPRTGDDKTSVLFAVPHEAGALFKVLEAFAKERINLSTIESRPLRGRAWEYVFFLDLIGHVEEKGMVRALAALERRALFVKVLGSYPAWHWPDPGTKR